MPIKRSAYKELRKGKKRHSRNIARTTELKTMTKKFDRLLADKKLDEAKIELKVLISKIDKAAAHGMIKDNTASRKISRLMKRLAKPAKDTVAK